MPHTSRPSSCLPDNADPSSCLGRHPSSAAEHTGRRIGRVLHEEHCSIRTNPRRASFANPSFRVQRFAPFHRSMQVPQHIQGPLIERLTATDGDEHHRLRAMPCTFLPAAPVIEKGAILLGDAMNMRHPLTGGGMTVILKDIEMLCQLLKTENIDFSDQEAVMSTVAKFHWQRKWSHAFVVNVLSMVCHTHFWLVLAFETSFQLILLFFLHDGRHYPPFSLARPVGYGIFATRVFNISSREVNALMVP
eukprot:m.276077 g.276077  ORF g.276077 m.276077 type:complete len:248 (+) comp54858_c0_seq13:1489-2232(+)